MWSNGIKITKNCPAAGGFAFRPLKPPMAGCRPQNPVWDTFELHWLTQHFFRVRHLHFLTISLPLPLAKFRLNSNHWPRLSISYSTMSLPHKKFLFWKFLITSLHVICGLSSPPQSKILATPMVAMVTYRGLESHLTRAGHPHTWKSC